MEYLSWRQIRVAVIVVLSPVLVYFLTSSRFDSAAAGRAPVPSPSPSAAPWCAGLLGDTPSPATPQELAALVDKALSPMVTAEIKDVARLGFTMISAPGPNDSGRLPDVARILYAVSKLGVPGDFLETGTYKGGASMVAKRVLQEHPTEPEKQVFMADTFEGLPPRAGADLLPEIDGERPMDAPGSYHAGGVESVKNNMRDRGLLDHSVHFIVGLFNDTIPVAARTQIKRLAVLRLDGDMYESTMVVLKHMYPLVSVGGYVIIDDYGRESWGGAKLG
jgi:hypothetical protein